MKTVLDLLDLDFIFSQQGPLRVDDFLQAANERGIDLERAHLDALHRAGILIPMYRMARDMAAVAAFRREERRQTGHGAPAVEAPAARILTTGPDLQEARVAGRLFDARAEPPRPWHRYEKKLGLYPVASPDGMTYPEVMNSSEFLYSPYHLLQLEELPPIIARMRARRRGQRMEYVVADQDINRHSTVRALFATTELIVGLSALENRYLPDIVGQRTNHSYGPLEAWDGYVAAFDPGAMRAWLAWTPQRILTSAERLLAVARRFDPNRDVHDLIELWRPSARTRLRGLALLAVDFRVAAELLLRFYEDLAGHGAAERVPAVPAGGWDRLAGRYTRNRAVLDRVLSDYGLSPHPYVVVVLEGETEYEIMMPRTMNFLGIPSSRTTIHLENAQTVDRDLSMLAAHVAAPAIAQQLSEGIVLLDRVATRFLVTVDPESAYADQSSRDKRHATWVQKIREALPPQWRDLPAIGDQIGRLVRIETWGDASFEYAHFTPEEIVQAIQTVHAQAGSATSIAHVTVALVERWRTSKANLEKIVGTDMRLSKVHLAEALWPYLERHLIAAREAGTLDTIPIARVARLALDLASTAAGQRAMDLRSPS